MESLIANGGSPALTMTSLLGGVSIPGDTPHCQSPPQSQHQCQHITRKFSMNTNQLVAIINDTPAVTTLVIAQEVGYDHASVIKLVREHVADLEEFGLTRFEIQPKTPGIRGGSDTEYAILNEQQCALILTYLRNSDVVREFKKRLIREFYAMREELRIRKAAHPSAPRVKNPVAQAQIYLLEEFDRVEQAQQLLSARVDAVETRLSTQDTTFYTVLGYARKAGAFVDNFRASVLGRKASRLSKERGYPVADVPDPRFGMVHSYHVDILQEVF